MKRMSVMSNNCGGKCAGGRIDNNTSEAQRHETAWSGVKSANFFVLWRIKCETVVMRFTSEAKTRSHGVGWHLSQSHSGIRERL